GGGRDLIEDFLSGTDRIDVSEFGLHWIGKKQFGGSEGELRFTRLRDSTLVEADLDGDRVADLQFDLAGPVALTSADFIM
ncbi:MAG TPA: M10 family metallopeptidase C-terminal domain-containing protein, partial [Allosphingosinicella sp.]|nr:M10 family metallopeptidase C-terminal domain-containing protein [Allosphingosinicella sp.]